MYRLRPFFRNITLLNAGLLLCIFISAYYFLYPQYSFKAYTLPHAKGRLTGNPKAEPPGNNFASLADYVIVADANLFHPERKIPLQKKEEAPLLPVPDLVLHGTLITDDVSLAYLEDMKEPRNTPGRGKRQIALKKGDMLNGFTLKEIEPDKIVMTRGEEKLTVSVKDSHGRAAKGTPAAAVSSRTQSALELLRARARQQMESAGSKTLPPQNAEEQAIFDAMKRSRGPH
jgi:hypothetical protein